jgi:hypothetical protein
MLPDQLNQTGKNMRGKRIRASIAATLVLLGMIVTVAPALAATTTTPNTGNGMQVSPLHTDLTINPGSTSTVLLFVENVTGATESLQALVNDFTAGTDESGIPQLLLNGQTDPTHGLKQFISPLPNITLKSGEQKEVQVVISIPSSAAAGGYYGAVRFAPVSASSGNNVNLAASVGSLILARVPGNIKEKMTIASFDVRKGVHTGVVFTTGKSLTAAVRLQNSGDVQEQPYGKLLLKRGNKVLESDEINNTDPRGNVLPGSIRLFSVPLSKVGSFGKYQLEGNFGYGANGQLLSANTTFYVIPLSAIILIVVIILLLVFLIFFLPKLIRKYNQRVIRQASRKSSTRG